MDWNDWYVKALAAMLEKCPDAEAMKHLPKLAAAFADEAVAEQRRRRQQGTEGASASPGSC